MNTTITQLGHTALVEVPHRHAGMLGHRQCLHPAGHLVLISIQIGGDVDGYDQWFLDKTVSSWAELVRMADFTEMVAATGEGDIHDAATLPGLAAHLCDFLGRSMHLEGDDMTVMMWRQDLTAPHHSRFTPQLVLVEQDTEQVRLTAMDTAQFVLHGISPDHVHDRLCAARAGLDENIKRAVGEADRQRRQFIAWTASASSALWSAALELSVAALKHQLGDLYGLGGVYFEQPELAVAAMAVALYLEAVEQQISPADVALADICSHFHLDRPDTQMLAEYETRLQAAGHRLDDEDDPVSVLWSRLAAPRYGDIQPTNDRRHPTLAFALGPALKSTVRQRLWPSGTVSATEALFAWTV